MVLLDLQKAFDKVDHEILLDKLKVMGFESISLEWMSAYLGNSLLTDGLLFLLYVNDMRDACACQLFLYADDSALL